MLYLHGLQGIKREEMVTRDLFCEGFSDNCDLLRAGKLHLHVRFPNIAADTETSLRSSVKTAQAGVHEVAKLHILRKGEDCTT